MGTVCYWHITNGALWSERRRLVPFRTTVRVFEEALFACLYDDVIFTYGAQLQRHRGSHRMTTQPNLSIHDGVQKYNHCTQSYAQYREHHHPTRAWSDTDKSQMGYCDLAATDLCLDQPEPDMPKSFSGHPNSCGKERKTWQSSQNSCFEADLGFEDDWSLSLFQKTIAIAVMTTVDGRPEPAGPMTYDERWAWAYRQCGLRPPEQFPMVYIHRSVHPTQHQSPNGPFPRCDWNWPYVDYPWNWSTVERSDTIRWTANPLAHHQSASDTTDKRSLGCDDTALRPLQSAWRTKDEHTGSYLRRDPPPPAPGDDRYSACENCTP